jgi:hypothetical protein
MLFPGTWGKMIHEKPEAKNHATLSLYSGQKICIYLLRIYLTCYLICRCRNGVIHALLVSETQSGQTTY